MGDLERNFQSLKAEFLIKSKASKANVFLSYYIKESEEVKLAEILGSHKKKSYYGNDLVKRFQVDFLLEYYNLLLVAALAGYIPNKLNSDTSNEICNILENEFVKKYYTDYYPYEITDFTLKFAKNEITIEQKFSPLTVSIFNEFISLYRFVRNDHEIERFLGMLDYVHYNDSDLNDVISVFKSYKKLNQTFTKNEMLKTEIDKAVWGFVKYTSFISRMKEIMIKASDFPLLQSSMWMFHGYYFDRLHDVMDSFFHEAFNNLRRTLSNRDVIAEIAEEISGVEFDCDTNISSIELEVFANDVVNKTVEDILFLLNQDWKMPIIAKFNY